MCFTALFAPCSVELNRVVRDLFLEECRGPVRRILSSLIDHMAEVHPDLRIVRFGTFEADLVSGELFKNGRKLKLQEQPFQLLAVLVRRPGQVITREDLQKLIWPSDTFVDFDQGLNRAVNKLREALDDSAGTPRFIETVPRRGYRFIAPVLEPILDTVPTPAERPVAAKIPRSRKAQAIAATALFVLAAIGLGIWRGGVFHQTSRPRFKSIAVLPLEDLSHDPEQAYFADGMADELITELAGIGSLDVISRTSVQRFKGTREPLASIARQLRADAIVEGTVLRSGNRVRVTVQLIDATADRHIWAESYERELGDVLSLQQRLAQDIALQVSASLTPGEQQTLARARPINPEAWDSYLRGRFFLNQRTEEGAHESIRYFERAINLEPSFAKAFAGLADTNFVLVWDRGAVRPAEGFEKGKAAALKALELDPDLAEAHASLIWEKLLYEWNWPDAEREARIAIRLSPNYATAHHHYSRFLALMGRFDECMRETRRTLELDPMDPIAGGNLAWNTYLARQYDQSAKQSLEMIHMFPSMSGFNLFLGWAYQAQGKYADALQALKTSVALDSSARGEAELGYGYAISGNEQAARVIADRLEAMMAKKYLPAYDLALIYVGLRQNDRAFEWLEKAYRERSPYLTNLKVDPQLDPVRSDPRFRELMRRVGFE